MTRAKTQRTPSFRRSISLFVVVSRQTKISSLRPLGCLLYLFLRVLHVLRGQTVYHHEEHEGHNVWITGRAKNTRVTKIIFPSLRLCGEKIMIRVCRRESAAKISLQPWRLGETILT